MKRQPPPNSSAQTSNVWVGLVSQAGSVQQCRAVYGGRVCIDFLPLEDKLGGVEHGIIGSTAQRSVAIASARLASMPSTASRASAADRLPLLQACSRAVHPSTSCRLVLIPSASRRARRHGSWSAFAASDHQANKSSTVCLGVFCAVAVAAIAWAAQLHAYYCPSYLRVCWNKRYSRPCLPPLWPRLYAEPFGLGEKKQVAFCPSSALSTCTSWLF